MSRLRLRLSVCFCFAALLILLTATRQSLDAQSGMATLSGVVTDPSGAAVPGAQVTLKSTTRNASRGTVTEGNGSYVLPSLLPGSYQLVVAAKGFETKTIANISLSSGQGSTLNVEMQLGAAVTQITVTDHPPLLETTTATLGSQLEARQITSLPLLSRNYTGLLTVLPGASPPNLTYSPGNVAPPGGGDATDTSFFGQKPRDNEFTLDGVPNAEYLFNGVPMYPPPDAIAEMKVESGTDSGAYGWASGANINVVTKSGTNAYHGSAWEYLQNNALNSRSFFSPSVGTLRYNQFGASAGGPLVIPHILSKKRAWYIYGWYGGIRQPSGGPYYQLVPTAAQLNGDFSANPAIYNPYTTVLNPDGSLLSRAPFAGNQIPTGTTAACSPNPTCLDPNSLYIAKTLSPLPNLTTPGPGNTNYQGHSTGFNTYNQWSARVDHQFGSRDHFFTRFSQATDRNGSTDDFEGIGSIQNENFINNVVSDTHIFSPSVILTASFGWQRFNDYTNSVGPDVAQKAGLATTFPISFNGKSLLPSLLIPDFPGYGQNFQYYGPENLFSWSGGVQKITGNHTLQFGAMYIRDHFITNNQTGTQVSFTSQPTAGLAPGTGFGLASFLMGLPSSASRVIGSTKGDMIGNYPSFYGQDTWRVTPKLTLNLGVRWDPQITMKSQLGSGTFVWETGQYVFDQKNPITGQPANAPFGLIPSDMNNVAPRFGVAYAINPKTVVRASYGIFYDVLGETAQNQQGNRGNWPYASPQAVGSLNAGLPTAYFENPFPGGAQGSTTPLGCQQCIEIERSATRTGYVQQWGLSIQRQLTPSLMWQTAYFGSHGIDLGGQIMDNTAVVPGTDPFQNRQLWPQFPPYVNNGYNLFPSFYDGLSVELRKQYSHSLAFLVSYTWSKTIDISDSTASDAYPFIQPTRFDIPLLRGPAGYNVTQRFTASYVWNIPGKTSSKLANAVVSGWNFSGIVTLDSGLPFYVTLSGDQANIGTVPGRVTSFPNLISNPVLSNPTPQEWFNTGAYQIPPFGTQGNAGKHALYTDGLTGFDGTFSKSWPLKERSSLQLRADFFNAFNLHNWGAPGAAADNTFNFGEVSSTRQGGRTIQLSMELHF
ncbi:MAG TPA: TonB-dependent receptor [Terriglobia bacterium]|nr:TonB-dependent receptor [Terriglobia bacterium]